MLLAICITQVKKRGKKKKKEGHETFALRGFKPGFSEFVRTKNAHLYPLDHLGKRLKEMFKRGIYSFSMVIDSFQG